ncbi:MAG TPA: hypothetical protein VFF52_14540 [Isosphaeraceae bacterium]|nr:hypothetical protein [Isosphaeraceae bacterium]
MTATTTAFERAEISRRNGCKSRGPRTPEGKERSKFNALKHGLDARTPILPGEDAETYRARIDAWTADFRPRNEFEHFLVEQAVRVSWQIERANRAETARLAEQIQTAAADQARRRDDEVAELGRRLLPDQFGTPSLDARANGQPGEPQLACSGTTDDSDHPSRLVQSLESTSAGCHWLLDRWVQLRAILDQGLGWQPSDQLRAIRLLGHQPGDPAETPVVTAISRACRALDTHRVDPCAEAGNGRAGSAVSPDAQPSPARRVALLQPQDQPEARRALLAIVDQATFRLEAMAEAHQEREAAEAAEQADRLSFDDSDSGERLRRLQMYCGRSFLRMLDVLLKMRPAGAAHPSPVVADPPGPVRTASEQQDPVSATTPRPAPIEPIDRFGPVSPIDVLAPSGPVPLATPPSVELPAHQVEKRNARNEPSRTAHQVEERNARNEPSRTAHQVEEQNARNEPSRTAHQVEEQNARNEPSDIAGRRDHGCEVRAGAGAAFPGVASHGGEWGRALDPTSPRIPQSSKDPVVCVSPSAVSPTPESRSPAVSTPMAHGPDQPNAPARRPLSEPSLALRAAVIHAAALGATRGGTARA